MTVSFRIVNTGNHEDDVLHVNGHTLKRGEVSPPFAAHPQPVSLQVSGEHAKSGDYLGELDVKVVPREPQGP